MTCISYQSNGKTSFHDSSYSDSIIVRSCVDFQVTGKGNNKEWQRTQWIYLNKLDKAGKSYESRFKILYSPKGLYVLFSGEDEKITSPFQKDFDKIFRGDVFEVFFHTDKDDPLYFEYEISPLEKELVLLLTQRNGVISAWRPWPYEEKDRVHKKVFVDGTATDKSAIRYWSAELFFPYSLLSSLKKTPPVKGTQWKANFCRLDYDSGSMVKWAWAPVNTSFHELHRYFNLIFN